MSKTHNQDQLLAQAEELQKQGDRNRAKEIYQEIINRPGERNSEQSALALTAMSKMEAAEGTYADAIRHADEAARIFGTLDAHAEESRALNSKAAAEIQQGDYGGASNDLAAALARARQARDSQLEVQTLNNQGSAAYYLGKYSAAASAYDQASEILGTKTESWTEYWLQITKVNQATLQQKLGRTDSALDAYRQVLGASQGLTNGDRAHIQGNIGALYRKLGDPQKALAAYHDAQGLYAQERDSDGEIGIRKNIAIVYALDLKDLKRARLSFNEALKLALQTHNKREEMQTRLYLGETLLRSGAPDLARSEFSQARTLADALRTLEERWKALYGIGRIEMAAGHEEDARRSFVESIATIEQTRGQLPLSPIRADFFVDKREPYDALLSILFEKGELVQAFELLERSRARVFQDQMLTKEYNEAHRATLSEVQTTLERGTLLLEYWAAADRVGVIWCTRDRCGMAVTHVSADDELRLRDVLARLPQSLEEQQAEALTPFASLIPPASALPSGMHHLIVVPDDWIEEVPFDMLPAGDGTRARLIERYDVSTVPTAALLLRPKQTLPLIRWPWSRQFVGFGDPVIVAEPSGGVSGNQSQLQSADYELRSVASAVHGKGKLFMRESDKKAIFLGGAANSAPILHVTTHAFADMETPENSRLSFSSGAGGGAAEYLYLREMYGVDLRGVQLATLSACDTARGRMIRGEGAQAFSRALLSSGAGAALTTLWRVDDRSTAEFMRQFYYFGMRRGTSKAEALRLTKLKFLRSGSELSHPAVWAAFVLSGDGRSSLPSVITWQGLGFTLCALFVAGALVGFFLLRRRQRIHRQHGS